ncbi:PRC-barrel domain-containing protein [Maritimibacter sp. DP1N21-5]|uniref:PRC-barrel domain-containing protein n=1 Tax=Maritimibacter sp. DP1N21-5 TaxID=2836867 RepID=UPI001C44AA9E|nr:PRC-barrel domain-containing protein [Maritimibacter sp. DP1N21-5]MBV7410528.1 PRC-barrel domain-containing protein [Maritimibacter sp. DP1N21-5]
MKPLNKTLMTSAAALIIAAGSAFAQDTTTDVETSTDAEVTTESNMEQAADDLNQAADELEQAAEDTGDAIEETADDVTNAAENTAEDAEEAVDDMAAETDAAVDEATDEMTAEVGEMTEGEISDDLEAAADLEISALIGTPVVSQDGNDVGEIDNFYDANGEIVAVVGIGGFLGIGEHDVAVDLDHLAVAETNDEGEPTQFMITGYTEEDLKAMTQFDTESASVIDSTTSLRSALNM